MEQSEFLFIQSISLEVELQLRSLQEWILGLARKRLTRLQAMYMQFARNIQQRRLQQTRWVMYLQAFGYRRQLRSLFGLFILNEF